jgi:hypothetical protein
LPAQKWPAAVIQAMTNAFHAIRRPVVHPRRRTIVFLIIADYGKPVKPLCLEAMRMKGQAKALAIDRPLDRTRV